MRVNKKDTGKLGFIAKSPTQTSLGCESRDIITILLISQVFVLGLIAGVILHIPRAVIQCGVSWFTLILAAFLSVIVDNYKKKKKLRYSSEIIKVVDVESSLVNINSSGLKFKLTALSNFDKYVTGLTLAERLRYKSLKGIDGHYLDDKQRITAVRKDVLGNIVEYRMYNDKLNKSINFNKSAAIEMIKTQGAVNASVVEGVLVGIDFDLDRLPIMHTYDREVEKNRLTIVEKLVHTYKNYYSVMLFTGESKVLSEEKLVNLVFERNEKCGSGAYGFTNALIVGKGDKYEIEANRGKFKTTAFNLGKCAV